MFSLRDVSHPHEGVGGVREASFERGVLFRETVTEWVPERRMSFTIAVDSIPTKTLDQHVTVGGEYFDVLDGTCEIVPLGPGKTELRLWSTHRLTTHFNPYASLWTDLVMRQIQGNILQVVGVRRRRGRCRRERRVPQTGGSAAFCFFYLRDYTLIIRRHSNRFASR